MMPLELSQLIQAYARPQSRPDWRQGSFVTRQHGTELAHDIINRADELNIRIHNAVELLIEDGSRRHHTDNWVEILSLVPSYYYFYEMLGKMLQLDFHRVLRDLLDVSPGGFQDFCEVRHGTSRWGHWPYMYTERDIHRLSYIPSDFDLLLEII
jgi:hypothetical protein